MLVRAGLVTAVLACALVAAVAQAALPSDPLTQNAVFEAVDLPLAWDVTTGSPDVVIAVVDSGVDASHPDLVGAVDQGYDFVDRDTDATDGDGHGTGVAGIAAARANNAVGAAGVCWSCRILPLRVLGPEGFALQTTMADAVDYAVVHGAAVVNVSLYGGNHNVRLEDAIVRARRAGVVVVAAAGNEGSTIREYPAAFSAALSVGATAGDGRLAGYSNRGDWVKFAAPTCVVTTQIGGGFGAGCGTSGATPLVAGIAALLRARAPFASVSQIESALARTARPVAGVRFGLVDAYAALQALGQPAPRFAPTLDGTANVGETLTAYTGVWAGARIEPTYAWQRCRGASYAT
ncbi:MAG: S8 family serine peptidase, partial [Gaiellaceae bacterium]